MILVDVANGKQRHVPYRDSKLTFLLQVLGCYPLNLVAFVCIKDETLLLHHSKPERSTAVFHLPVRPAFFCMETFSFYNHDFEMLLRVAEPNLQIFILTAGFSWRQF
jgi:hypothetical protein